MSRAADHRPPTVDRRPIKIIGIGNPLRGDDSVGVVVANKLTDTIGDQVVIEISNGEGVDLIHRFKDVSTLILIDAVRSGAEAGTVHRLDASSQTVPSSFFNYSTHAFSVAEAIELARALGRLPEEVVIFGIEGSDFSPGHGLTSAVEASGEKVVGSVIGLLAEVPLNRQD